MAVYRPYVGRMSAVCWPHVGRMLAVCRPYISYYVIYPFPIIFIFCLQIFNFYKNDYNPGVISRKAKEIIPVSVIVILSLYVLVAVPLTLVEIFNTNLVEG